MSVSVEEVKIESDEEEEEEEDCSKSGECRFGDGMEAASRVQWRLGDGGVFV